MKRHVTALDARRRLGELLESVYHGGDEVVIERAGRPMAVVIPAERYEALERSRARLWALIEEAQEANRNVPVAELEDDIAVAIQEARQRPSAPA